MDTQPIPAVPTQSVRLPSGAVVALRRMGVAQESLLAQAAARSAEDQNQALDQALAACAVRLEDPGPYAMPPGAPPDVTAMLSGDRFALLIALRCASYADGRYYEVTKVRCPLRCPAYDYRIDLENDLVRRDLEDEDFDRIRSGKPFGVTVDGKLVQFGALTGRVEAMGRRFVEEYPDRMMACLMRARILSVEGVEPHDILEWIDGNNQRSTRFPGLAGEEAEQIRDAFDAHDCGIDTDVLVPCPRCGTEVYVALPFGAGFLIPSTGIIARKRSRQRAHRHGGAASGA